MTSDTPKPMLTRREVEYERQVLKDMDKFRDIDSTMPKIAVGSFIDGQNQRLDCIEAMADLLERWQKSITMLGERQITISQLMQLQVDTLDFLTTFNATGGGK